MKRLAFFIRDLTPIQTSLLRELTMSLTESRPGMQTTAPAAFSLYYVLEDNKPTARDGAPASAAQFLKKD